MGEAEVVRHAERWSGAHPFPFAEDVLACLHLRFSRKELPYLYMKKIFLCLLLLLPAAAIHAQERQLSIREFLKCSPEDTTSYRVTGVVEKIRSTSSGSFYLKDKSGKLLVYGLIDPQDQSASFSKLDILKGDTLTVLGRFTLYAGNTPEMKDGRLVKKSDGPEHGLSFYDRLDQKPSFHGKTGKEAHEAFKAWVQAHIDAPENGEKGTVRVQYVIGKNGGIQEVQVIEGASPALNKEAVRVVSSAPKWKPAKMDGNGIRMTYSVYVEFE